VNLVAGREIAKELMQTELTGERLADELLQLLDPKKNKEARAELRNVAHRLGQPGASERAAELILKSLV